MRATPSDPKTSVQVVGSRGQISLGKEYAGRQVLVEDREPGVWLIRTALDIPENEGWMHTATGGQDLQEALAWAEANSPQESNPDTLFREIESANDTLGFGSRVHQIFAALADSGLPAPDRAEQPRAPELRE
jgi:hypothetical protein